MEALAPAPERKRDSENSQIAEPKPRSQKQIQIENLNGHTTQFNRDYLEEHIFDQLFRCYLEYFPQKVREAIIYKYTTFEKPEERIDLPAVSLQLLTHQLRKLTETQNIAKVDRFFSPQKWAKEECDFKNSAGIISELKLAVRKGRLNTSREYLDKRKVGSDALKKVLKDTHYFGLENLHQEQNEEKILSRIENAVEELSAFLFSGKIKELKPNPEN